MSGSLSQSVRKLWPKNGIFENFENFLKFESYSLLYVSTVKRIWGKMCPKMKVFLIWQTYFVRSQVIMSF